MPPSDPTDRPVSLNDPCYECGSTRRMGTACADCNPEITDPNFGLRPETGRQASSVDDLHDLAEKTILDDLHDLAEKTIVELREQVTSLREQLIYEHSCTYDENDRYREAAASHEALFCLLTKIRVSPLLSHRYIRLSLTDTTLERGRIRTLIDQALALHPLPADPDVE